MSRVDVVEYDGKEIVKADLSSAGVEEAVTVFQEASDVIKTKARKSVLFLADVADVSYTRETVSGIKNFSMSNNPYIKATAVVGMDAVKQAILSTVRFLSLHEIKSFDTEIEAKDWLAQLK
jgi:hypothetical protein